MIIKKLPLQTPWFRALSDEQCEQLYQDSLVCLQRVGVKVLNEEGRDVLGTAGCRVEGERVYIPPQLVKDALAVTQREFTIWGRKEGQDIQIENGRVHFGPGPTCTYFIDPFSGERRRAQRGDAAMVARVCDALDNLDYTMSLSIFDNVIPALSPLYEFAELMAHSTKPPIAWATGPEILAEIYRVAAAVAGGEDALNRRPNFAFFATYESPLKHADGQMGAQLWAARHGIPVICLGGPTVGLESPPTGASALILYLAAALSALTIVQTATPGAAMAIGAALGAMDLRTARPAYGSPEMSFYTAGAADLARYLGVPFMGTAGASESKELDAQAGVEIAFQVLLSAMSGANLVHDVGFLDCADIGSLELLVLADEAISMTRHMLRGVEVTPQSSFLDLIEKVGPGGHFLSQPQSVSLCKKEIWVPKVFDRNAYAVWERNGSITLLERIRARVQHILGKSPDSVLSKEQQTRVERILAEAVWKYS
jgi:trimethylamine--corrinoid protein Co-methyltransferase